MTAGHLVCRCGRVAEEADVECSLCGRDLSSLRQATERTYPARTVGGPQAPDASYGHATTADSRSSNPYGHPATPPPQQSWPAVPPYGWEAPGRAAVPAGAGTDRMTYALLIGVLALVIVVAGLALGYFGLARWLFG